MKNMKMMNVVCNHIIRPLEFILFPRTEFLCSILQVKTFRPQLVAVRNESLINELKDALADADYKPEIVAGEQGVIEVSSSS